VSGTAPKHYETLDFDLTLDMAYWGARVLHYRSVELAERNAIPLSIKKSHEEGRQTTLGQNEIHRKTRKERAPEMEMTKVLSVNTNTQILNIRFLDLSLTDGLQSLMNSFENSRLATPQIIYQRGDTSKSCEFFITLPEETFDAVVEAVKNYSKKAKLKVETSTQWATISITGRGFVNSNMAFEMSKKLAEKKIYPEGLIVSPLTLSVLVQKNKAVEGAALLHREFVENATANG
jgi:aspartate kinase